jgi:hypothetical protein
LAVERGPVVKHVGRDERVRVEEVSTDVERDDAWLADCTAASRAPTSSALSGEHLSLNRTTIMVTSSHERARTYPS